MRDNLLEPCKRKSWLPRAYFSTQAEAMATPPGELIKFSIRAIFQPPSAPGPVVPAAVAAVRQQATAAPAVPPPPSR